MSTLSQFAGGTDRFRLKVKNGPYVDEYLPTSSNVYIRDFTAQNDSLMISMTRGDVLIGKRVDQLYPAAIYNRPNLTANRDFHIGGDPYADVTSINRAGIGTYLNGSQVDLYRASNGRIPQATFDGGPTFGYGVTIANPLTSNLHDVGFARFIYTSNNQLFFIHWKENDNNLYVFRWDTTSDDFVIASYTYGGTKTGFNLNGDLDGSGNGPGNIEACTAPEIDPFTGNIFMLVRRTATDWFRIQYSVTAQSWTVLDVTTIPANFDNTNSASCLAIDNTGSNMLLTYGFSITNNPSSKFYWYSSNGGNTWNQGDLTNTNIAMRQAGYANGKFYSINTNVSSSNSFFGDLVSVNTGDLATPGSWEFEENCDISECVFLRNNGLGTACYVSTGGNLSQVRSFQPQQSILRLTGNS